MNNIVFLDKIGTEPFTTSKIIAEVTGIGHRHIKKQITNHTKQLERFGLLVAHATESIGGRPEEITRLNEQQATLLITFLKNTPAVVEFKTNLVKSFYDMRMELFRRQTYRMELKPLRREMTDVIQEKDSSKWAYKKYTDLAYKSALGMTAAQIRQSRNASRTALAVDYLNSSELQAVSKRIAQIGVLLDVGMSYDAIKAALLHPANIKQMLTVVNLKP